MKHGDNWRSKLDNWALEALEGHRKASAIRNRLSPDEWLAKLDEIAAEHPQIRVLGKVEVLPQFVELLLQTKELASVFSSLQPSPGSKTMSQPSARFVEIMQKVTLALEDKQMRVIGGMVSALLITFVWEYCETISKSKFGDKGPTTEQEFSWLIGTALEDLGRAVRSGKLPSRKGRVNVEQVQLMRLLLEHQTAKLTYRELQEALRYAGVSVDEENLRLFAFRARKKGWIASGPPKSETAKKKT